MPEYHTTQPTSNNQPTAEERADAIRAGLEPSEFWAGYEDWLEATEKRWGPEILADAAELPLPRALDVPALLDNTYSLNGREIDIIEFLLDNIDDISTEQAQQIAKMEPGEAIHYNQGAGGVFELRRTA